MAVRTWIRADPAAIRRMTDTSDSIKGTQISLQIPHMAILAHTDKLETRMLKTPHTTAATHTRLANMMLDLSKAVTVRDEQSIDSVVLTFGQK